MLDVGTADGHPVAAALVARGCEVWGIELDPDAAASAREFCRKLVIGDVEKLDGTEDVRVTAQTEVRLVAIDRAAYEAALTG